MKIGDTRVVSERMCYSHTGAFWLAGREVSIIDIDEGEGWEPTIVRVRATNERDATETVWMNPKDFVPLE